MTWWRNPSLIRESMMSQTTFGATWEVERKKQKQDATSTGTRDKFTLNPLIAPAKAKPALSDNVCAKKKWSLKQR
jgi:hypothetical protein